jgi:hypothetical protein
VWKTDWIALSDIALSDIALSDRALANQEELPYAATENSTQEHREGLVSQREEPCCQIVFG